MGEEGEVRKGVEEEGEGEEGEEEEEIRCSIRVVLVFCVCCVTSMMER